MDFLKKVGSTAESLLDQVDQKTAEISKDVRSGSRAARIVAERLEKRERINVSEGGLIDSDVAKQIERIQADLDAAGEVLQRSQQLAAERELKLSQQLEKDREDRERREDELMSRIRQLESSDTRAALLEATVEQLREELDDARGSRNQDTVELQAQAEQARADAEHARAALATAMKQYEFRIAELEKTNLELLRDLSLRKISHVGKEEVGEGEGVSAVNEEARKQMREIQDLEDKLVASEDKRASLEMQLNAERTRLERLETELRKSSMATIEIKEAQAKSVIALETKIATLKREADEARAQTEALRLATQDNGRDALEKRLESLSSHLELKQRQIDLLRSEKRALEQKLNDSSAAPILRPRPNGVIQNGFGGDVKGRFTRLRLDAIRHKNLAKAIDVVDGLTLNAAGVMRSQPLVRLGFVVYLVVLQLWVFHVISWTSTPSSSQNHPGGVAPIFNPSSAQSSLRGAST